MKHFLLGSELSVQTLCAMFSSLAYLMIGLVRAWAATGLPSLETSTVVSDSTASWIVSLPPMGAILGSCLSFWTMNYLGRKYSIIMSGIIFFLSFLLIGLASILASVEIILTGRALSGVGVGLAVPSAAIYVAECSSPSLRGTLSSLPAFFLALGVLIGYVFGIFLPWHHLAYFCCTPAVLLVISMMFLPKTPTYLTRRGNAELAARSLAWLRGTSVEAVSKEISAMTSEEDKTSNTETSIQFMAKTFFSYQNLCPLLLTFVLHFLQNWSGVNVIVFKTVHVFETVGSSIDKYTCTAIVGVVQLLFTGGIIIKIIIIIIVNIILVIKIISYACSVYHLGGQGRQKTTADGVWLGDDHLHGVFGSLHVL